MKEKLKKMKKKINNKKYKAFTLAETLITLMIIGVIAAITIPTLKDSSDKEENIALLKKANTTATNMFANLRAKYGPAPYWSYGNQRAFKTGEDATIRALYTTALNVAGNTLPAGYSAQSLKADALGTETEIDGTKTDFTKPIITADGMFWFLSLGYSNGSVTNERCGLLAVDVNGGKKPNRMGVDMFVFNVTADGIVALDVDDCTSTSTDGFGCAKKLLIDPDALNFIYE